MGFDKIKKLIPVGSGKSLAAMGFALAAGALGAGYSTEAQATTSFARQTGFSCFACHTRYPSLTAVGKRYFLNGYRTPNIRPQLEHGTRGSWGGDRLSYPLEEYQWWRLRISPFTKEKGRIYTNPDNNEKWFALLPERVSWGASGPIGDHLGMYLEVYYSPHEAPESGFNNARGEFRDSKTEFDELELVWGTELPALKPGNWVGFYMNNRGYRKVNNRGGTAIYGHISGAFTNNGSIGLHAFDGDHFYGTLAILPGRSKNWDKKDIQLNLDWWVFNEQQNDLWLKFLYTDVKDNSSPTRAQSAFGGPNNVRTSSKAYDFLLTYTKADWGPHTFDGEWGVGTITEKLNSGTSREGEFKGTRTGGGFRYWYNRTYGFEMIMSKWLKYEEQRGGVTREYARPRMNFAYGFMYFMATNQLWSFQIEDNYGNPAVPGQDPARKITEMQLKLELGW